METLYTTKVSIKNFIRMVDFKGRIVPLPLLHGRDAPFEIKRF
jgi:hypothetical protein